MIRIAFAVLNTNFEHLLWRKFIQSIHPSLFAVLIFLTTYELRFKRLDNFLKPKKQIVTISVEARSVPILTNTMYFQVWKYKAREGNPPKHYFLSSL